jgi:hypothetical protein
MMRGMNLAPLASLALAASSVTSPATTDSTVVADLVLTGGRVVTLDDANPEGEAIAMADGRVLAVGSAAEIAKHVGDGTRVIDLAGAFAMPGFIEGHGHFLGIGDQKLQLDLVPTTSWDEIVAKVRDGVANSRPGELVRGRGWHQSKWTRPPEGSVEGLPTHHALSAVSPDNPVVLTHASGHMSFANAAAMTLSGITRETPDPPGGEIVRDAKGEPSGAFRETAARLLGPVWERATPPDRRRVAELARDECIAKGITSFQDAGSSFEDLALFREMAEAGELGLRLWVMLRESDERLQGQLGEPIVGVGANHLTLGGIKVSIDGALGSHGAWLLAPYADLPHTSGLNTVPIDSLHRTAAIAAVNDLQLCVHAIGDRANREVLDVFEKAFARFPSTESRRWRIEHAQHLHPADIPRFAALGVVASMQGIHCTSDAAFVVDRLGETRAREGAYVWKTLVESGAVVSNGTDAPVEDVDPIAGYYATVSRMTKAGTRFFPSERLGREQALRSYTIDCAYAAFEEHLKGSLEPGKLADVTVLSKDILAIDEADIPTAEVLYTIVGGRVLHEK